MGSGGPRFPPGTLSRPLRRLAAASASLLLLLAACTVLALAAVGVGLPLVGPVVGRLRRHAAGRRAAASPGPHEPPGYRPLPEGRPVRGAVVLLGDPATWRDLRWLAVDATAGLVLAAVVPGLWGGACWSVLLVWVLWPVFPATRVIDLLVPQLVHGAPGVRVVAVAWSVAQVVAARAWAGPVAAAHEGMTAALLRPPPTGRLERRVAELARTRADSVDLHAAEVRRIERDLHDGAQARLVSLGISLGLAQQLLRDDPRAAVLLERARDENAAALDELRALVRGIHPPVLADRGLAGALEALVLTRSDTVDLDVDLPGRPPAPVESAAYFAVAECLTNAAKHAGASRTTVRVRHRDGVLHLTVADDGRGGADPDAGTGLAGIRRRLTALDGTMHVASPPGGPTTVTMEVPCASCSPRT